MTRVEEVVLEVPALEATVRARVLWEGNEELAQLFVSCLPCDTCLSHALASGELMYAPMRLVGLYEPGRSEGQESGKAHTALTKVGAGGITLEMDNYKAISIYYGKVTEPLPETPPVAEVVAEDLPTLRRIGREVWLANFLTHQVMRARVRPSSSRSSEIGPDRQEEMMPA